MRAAVDFDGQVLDLEPDLALAATLKAPPRALDMSKGLPHGDPLDARGKGAGGEISKTPRAV